jgi:hypothetical protein
MFAFLISTLARKRCRRSAALLWVGFGKPTFLESDGLDEIRSGKTATARSQKAECIVYELESYLDDDEEPYDFVASASYRSTLEAMLDY